MIEIGKSDEKPKIELAKKNKKDQRPSEFLSDKIQLVFIIIFLTLLVIFLISLFTWDIMSVKSIGIINLLLLIPIGLGGMLSVLFIQVYIKDYWGK